MNPQTVIVAVVKKHATLISGELGGVGTEIMLDSGSSVSIIREELVAHVRDVIKVPPPSTPQPQLVTAAGDPPPNVEHIKAQVRIRSFR